MFQLLETYTVYKWNTTQISFMIALRINQSLCFVDVSCLPWELFGNRSAPFICVVHCPSVRTELYIFLMRWYRFPGPSLLSLHKSFGGMPIWNSGGTQPMWAWDCSAGEERSYAPPPCYFFEFLLEIHVFILKSLVWLGPEINQSLVQKINTWFLFHAEISRVKPLYFFLFYTAWTQALFI